MKITIHISAAVAVLLSLVSCSGDDGKVIPRSKLAEIYAEMFVTDQWLMDTPGVRRLADTSLVYEPILRKYGYTSEDYRVSVDRYMDDPERFSRIFRTSAKILEKKIEGLQERRDELQKEQARELMLEKLRFESELDMEEIFPYLYESPYEHYYDTLAVEIDSSSLAYRLKNIQRADTLYDGVKMVVRDTSQVHENILE